MIGQGNPLFFEDPDFKRVVEAHQGVTPAQIVMSWLVQRDILPIAKSQNVERMKGNKTVRSILPSYTFVVMLMRSWDSSWS